ncbi:hypothetical protein GUJ93_ZPchr0008g11426 [Zizania palustris]|nr:hypothetical protein GUJ93_ZPchr0008g11426 [Zizania palustris]KAG8046949.1 hypothetical protein GUJ93_ZPchr0008g11426 [Zizania palustris]
MDRELELLATFVSMLKFILEDEASDLRAVNHPASWPTRGRPDECIVDLPMEEEEQLEEEDAIMDPTSSTRKPAGSSGRFTMEQRGELIRAFDSCSHPDLDTRNDLADRLNITSDRVKFWFQNHRTQLKSLKITEENLLLRLENVQLLLENTELRKRFRARMINATCPTCQFPLFHTEVEQNICVNHVANPMPQLGESSNSARRAASSSSSSPPLLPSSGRGMAIPGSYQVGVMMHNPGMPLPAASAGQHAPYLHATNLVILPNLSGDAEISILVDHAYYAMEELIRLVQINHPLWLPNMDIMGIEALNYQEYAAMSRSVVIRPAGLKVDATRDVAIVKGGCVQLVESLSDVGCWAELFSGIVASASSTRIISTSPPASCDGLIQLMRAELLVMSPAVPVCEVTFLRYSRQIARGLWSVVDLSIDDSILRGDSRAAQFSVQASSSSNTATRRMGIKLLPSGCFIQDLDNGYSKVTWVMHAAYDETKVPMLHWPYLRSGKALGACRWLASLQRQSQFLSNLHSSVPGLNNAMEEQLRRRSVLHLVRQMVTRFTAVSGSMTDAWQVGDSSHVISRRIGRPGSGEPDGVVLTFTVVTRLPGVRPRRVYDYLRDEQCLFEWRQLFVADLRPPQARTASLRGLAANGDAVPQFHRVVNGLHEGHAISLINPRGIGGTIISNLVLQEARTDASGSLIVYAGTDVHTMHGIMDGSIHPAGVFLIPSGCSILPDCSGASPPHPDQASSSTSRSNGDGSIVTVTYQMFVSSLSDVSTLVGSIERGRIAFMNATVIFRAALQAIGSMAE